MSTDAAQTSFDIAVIGGDGIGPEVVAEGLKVLGASGVDLRTTEYDLGAARWHRTGETLPDSVVEELRGHDGILLGAIGDPSVPSGVLERGLLLKLRFALDHYVNLRPSRLYPSSVSPLANPGNIDFVVVREGTEGPYIGNGGVIRQGALDVALEDGSCVLEGALDACVHAGMPLLELVQVANRRARLVLLGDGVEDCT